MTPLFRLSVTGLTRLFFCGYFAAVTVAFLMAGDLWPALVAFGLSLASAWLVRRDHLKWRRAHVTE
jgi:hypothetical protein